MKTAALQQAIYTALNDTSLSSLLSSVHTPLPSIFSDVPQSDDSQSDACFPYVVIGSNTTTAYDTKDQVGGNAVAQIDVYDRSTSKLSTGAVVDAVDALMRRQPLVIEDATHITTELENSTLVNDPDGRTAHWILLYRILWVEDEAVALAEFPTIAEIYWFLPTHRGASA